MSSSERDPSPEPTVESSATSDHIAAFRAEDGSTVIYDERKHTAWIQSKTALSVDEAR